MVWLGLSAGAEGRNKRLVSLLAGTVRWLVPINMPAAEKPLFPEKLHSGPFALFAHDQKCPNPDREMVRKLEGWKVSRLRER
jgi:hypothetical protein